MEISPQEREWFAREIHDSRISLYRLALSITGDPHEAEEAVAEAVYRAYVKFHSLRDREKFHSWILKITANAARGLCRRREKTISLEEVSVKPVVPGPESDHALWQVVQMLSQDQREAVVLFYYENLTTEEIARIVGAAPGTVRVRLSRAREQLRKLLEVKQDG